MAIEGAIFDMMPPNVRKGNRGFTLIELLVAMALGLLVLGAVISVFVSQNRTNAAQQEVAYAQQNVRAAMDLMARDIRGAGYNPTNAGSFDGVLAAGATYIRIQSDFNRDADTNDPEAGDPDYASAPVAPDETDPNEDVTYALDNLTLLRGQRIANPAAFSTTSPGQWTAQQVTMVQDVANLQFGYVLVDGTVLDPPGAALTAAQRADVRTVIIRLGVRTENPDRDTGQFRVRNLVSRVRIRNMGFQDIET
jgi:prepilin-type N-terminal cleavage/methylation domain-containing protein